MDTRALALNPQASQTLILFVFIYLIHFQIPYTSHCILISYIYVVENITLLEFTLSTQYLQSCYKTSNRNVTLCYIVRTIEYRFGKLTMTKLDLPNSSYRKLGSETKTTNSCSKCIDARRNQQDHKTVGYSSSEKISCKCGS